MKFVIITILLTAAMYMTLIGGIVVNQKTLASDEYIRHRVVLIRGEHNSCTGIEILAPSGKNYILTAKHCRVVLANNETTAIDEDGKKVEVELIGFAEHADLMLLSPMDKNSIKVGKRVALHQHVHTITHGGGKPSFRTDGEILDDEDQADIVFPIFSQLDMDRCSSDPDQSLSISPMGMVCVMKNNERMSTARVVPGSSGGPALNEAGELIGIVSSTDGFFSGLVRIEDIQDFLKDK